MYIYIYIYIYIYWSTRFFFFKFNLGWLEGHQIQSKSEASQTLGTSFETSVTMPPLRIQKRGPSATPLVRLCQHVGSSSKDPLKWQLVLAREGGNDPGDSLKGNHKRWSKRGDSLIPCWAKPSQTFYVSDARPTSGGVLLPGVTEAFDDLLAKINKNNARSARVPSPQRRTKLQTTSASDHLYWL